MLVAKPFSHLPSSPRRQHSKATSLACINYLTLVCCTANTWIGHKHQDFPVSPIIIANIKSLLAVDSFVHPIKLLEMLMAPYAFFFKIYHLLCSKSLVNIFDCVKGFKQLELWYWKEKICSIMCLYTKKVLLKIT
jgi:hypothetical protein